MSTEFGDDQLLRWASVFRLSEQPLVEVIRSHTEWSVRIERLSLLTHAGKLELVRPNSSYSEDDFARVYWPDRDSAIRAGLKFLGVYSA